VSRGLADASRPGRNQEIHRIAKWESQHLIENGGEVGLIGTWLRAVGAPAPDAIAPPEGGSPLRVGQAGRVVLALGPGDVPLKSEDIRVASRAAGACGGWAALRGALDAIDWTAPDARRALRAAVGTRSPRALQSARAWNQLQGRAPRLPSAEDVGVGRSASGDGGSPRKRRRRRRKMSTAEVADTGSTPTPTAEGDGSGGDSPAQGTASRRRRRRRRRRSGGSSTGTASGGGAPGTESAGE